MATRNSKNTGVRMFQAEWQALHSACEALSCVDSEVTPSLLLDVAGLEEAQRLGFTPSNAGRFHRPPGQWENEAPALEQSFSCRVTLTLSPLHLAPLEAAAAWAGLEVPRFLMGSFWRFLANAQRSQPTNARLQGIWLPEKYRS